MQTTWTIARFDLLGAVFMIVLGATLHFVFAWSGGWRPVAVFAAVNESVWEHLKLAFWPGALWAMLAPAPRGVRRADLIAAKGLTLLVTAILIVVVFQSYTAVLGRNLLPLDIGAFVLAIATGQALSVVLLRQGAPFRPAVLWIGLGLLGVQVAAYGSLTFLPPDYWLFIEARSGIRGIPPP